MELVDADMAFQQLQRSVHQCLDAQIRLLRMSFGDRLSDFDTLELKDLGLFLIFLSCWFGSWYVCNL